MPRKAFKNRLQYQITIYFTVLIAVIINVAGWVLYFRAEHYFDVELGKKLISVVQAGADLMDAELLQYLRPGDEAGNFYSTSQHRLEILREKFAASRIYIIDRSLKTLLDTTPNTPIGSRIPYLESSLLEINTALNGQAVFSTLYRGYDGNLYKSAFAPVTDRDGNVVAIAGADASPVFLQVIDKIRGSILLVNFLSFVIAVVVSLFMARSIVNPVNKLVKAALRVSKGDLNMAVEIGTKNEIGFLGQVFNDMQKNIKSNEEKLLKLRQKAEAEADSIKTYNDYILQSIASGVLTIDLHGTIIVLNPEAARILKVNCAQSLGKKYTNIFQQGHPFFPFLQETIKKRPKAVFDEIQLFHDDVPMTVSVQLSPLRDPNNRVIGTNWVFTDLTEIRKLQERVKEKERMAYLGEISAAIAHEIRNPLNSISLFIGLLKRELGQHGKQVDTFHKVQDEIHALNRIVTDFLIFARPQKLVKRDFLLSELFQEVLFLAENPVKEKSIAVAVDLPDADLTIYGDFDQLKQALLNLVLNAVQAMDNNGALRLTGSSILKSKSVVGANIRIADTGKGIPQKDFEKIFEPFYSTRSQGTGLGLSIVKNIIVAHKGTITVESKPDQGTSFVIELPKEERR